MQLREANEFLVIAAIKAQSLADVAEKAHLQMSYIAEHDFLTGLPNRALLVDRLAQSIARAQRRGKGCALFYLDVDHFKYVNDSLGHAAGDELLRSIAQRLQACVRQSDTVSRMGGDEFVVLLNDVGGVGNAVITANKLIGALAEPHLIAGQLLHVSLSIGISLYPRDGIDVESIVQCADVAMYRAKASGRNNYQVFSPDMIVDTSGRRAIEELLHDGIKHDGFVLNYQPKVHLETGAIIGAEALFRLRQSEHPLASTASVIRIAEDCGLIVPIGAWVMREACCQMVAWNRSGLNLKRMAVNVSAIELHGRDFFGGVLSILEDTGMDPHLLELEVTESGLMQDTKRTMDTLHALKELGITIAVDDFGTGYSCLSYLRRFPIDTLKIDQSFVGDIDGDGGNALVSAVIAIGGSLKLKVTAEGIETQQHLDFLRQQGCSEGQGYFLGRPVAADGFSKLLESERR